MIKSQAIQFKDFSTDWYKKWSILLKQEQGYSSTQRYHNKAWQNAIILQALDERGYIKPGNRALGFGVGMERVPSALAALGLQVTATDQDFKSGEKGGWNNGQLTRTRKDLNQHNIAPTKLFNQNVEFENCDMTKISKKFNNKYDIIWSNCALGHLGSIDASLSFIEKSLDCLKPGGIAVHTTETNVVSNTDTIETGGTVIFRRSDLTKLLHRLRSQGYKCAPLSLDFGKDLEDMGFSFDPFEDDVLLKLNAGGYILSQMVLIVQKPMSLHPQKTARLKKVHEDIVNSRKMNSYIKNNTDLTVHIAKHETVPVQGVKAQKLVTKITMKPNETKTVRLKFTNTSNITYYELSKMFHASQPFTMITSSPVNGASRFTAKSWLSPARPNPAIVLPTGTPAWKGIKPNTSFWADLEIKAPAKAGVYSEEFCFTLEGLPTIPGSEFTIELTVKK